MLLLLDSYTQPTYITRAWCIFECYIATVSNIPITILLPESADASFGEIVGSSLHRVRDTFSQLDVRSATASYKADEDVIKHIILNSEGGFGAINSAVKNRLLQWLTSKVQGYTHGGL